jgi:predicted enzyme related to lactoylglutathione lyase
MTTSPTAPALYLTEIKVTDWARVVRWYVETLGLRLTLEDTAHDYALFEAGAGRLAIKGTAPLVRRGSADPAAHDAVRLIFETTDVDAERDRLAARGVVVTPPEDSPEGYRAIRLRDPEGTPITLFCWK